MKKYFSPASFSAGVVVGALLAGAWFFGGNPELITLSEREAQLKDGSIESTLIVVNDQPAGMGVTVESVSVAPPGVWVAVRELVGEELGNVLGASRVGAPRTDIPVALLRATLPGRTYAVELYRDDNEGMFDHSKNSVYIDFETGERVVARFTTLP